MEFEVNFTPLRDLEEGDIYLTKMDTISEYVKDLGDDRHLLKNYETGKEYEVPHGKFPVFKKIG